MPLTDHWPDGINPLSANPTKWLNTLKQFVGCRHFVGLELKGLNLGHVKNAEVSKRLGSGE